MTGAGDAAVRPPTTLTQARPRASAPRCWPWSRRSRSPAWCCSPPATRSATSGDDAVAGRSTATWSTSSTTPSVLYLSGLAAAIGFRMNLFNIGVEGQYRIASFAAAAVAGEAWLPGYLNTVLAIVVAMVVGAALGRHRGPAARHPRRQRGHLDDHAERDRGLAGRPTCSPGRRARAGQQQPRHQDDPRGQPGRRHPVR